MDRFFGGGYSRIQIAGSDLPGEVALNFVSGASAVDDPGNDRTNVTVLGGGAALPNGDYVGQLLQWTGSIWDGTMATPNTGDSPVWNGSDWIPTQGGQPIVPPSTVTFSLSAASVDVTAFTVPASPTGNSRFVLMGVDVRLNSAITNTGNVVVKAGLTAGGTDFLVASAAWTSATAVGTLIGESVADLGASFIALQGYRAILNAGQAVIVRATTSGTLSAGAARVYVYGYYLP
jgi:hypothetical protein